MADHEAYDGDRFLGVFEFILLVILISTIGKVLEARGDRMYKTSLPRAPAMQHLEEMIGEMNHRLARLEEERDFYRALLEPPDAAQRVPGRSGDDDDRQSSARP